ncbi:MAG: hypothetical protein J7K13_03860, partial [Thermoplasmata archaeon]|nr:hypothetical protein [Thermoplasmata archaeon]
PKEKVKQWPARDVKEISSDDPYEIAADIALNDWSYSDEAVVAVINNNSKAIGEKVSGVVTGAIYTANMKEEHFTVTQTNRLNPIFYEFQVPENYKYIKAEAWWDCLIIPGMMIPTGDPDVQLYCKNNGNWMQSSAASSWNVYSPPGHEYTFSYVYKPGEWRVGITDFPTEGNTNAPIRTVLGLFTLQGSLFKALFGQKVIYKIDVTMYPGTEVEIPDVPSYDCENVTFVLSWSDPNAKLGFSIIGPAGEVIFTEINESADGVLEIDIDRLGGCLDGERYKVSVFSLQDINTPIEFKVSYDWDKKNNKEHLDSLTSAAEASILASLLNTPLLYTYAKSLPETTKNALYKLGVKRIYLVSLGDYLSDSTEQELKQVAKIEREFVRVEDVYSHIMDLTSKNDVIFTTINPWTCWYVAELKPAGEYKGALFIGPAAYIAAHHGSPVIIIENHPELSSAVVWHNEFWRRFCASRYDHMPSVAEMVITGKRIYSFLKEHGFDKPGMESIITVADQYDIGIPWDRIFPGVANSGRICGSPIDTSFWISRIVFYPALIFENPALKGEVNLINGSTSIRKPLGIFKKPLGYTLSIVKKSEKESFKYPVLCSFVTHKYRFNERASKYYGTKYQCADGLIPGESETMNPIDQGVGLKYIGKEGSLFPDLTESEVIPFYLRKAGYSPAFSTNFSAVASNLNSGVILWFHSSHGAEKEGGRTYFWDTKQSENALSALLKPYIASSKEINPWRGYDWLLGSTEEPDTMTMDLNGIFPFTNIHFPLIPATGKDWVLARKPIRELLNKIIPIVDPFRVDNLYDGLTGTLFFSKFPLVWYNATSFDKQLNNLHSVGFITSICQTSNTYFHLVIIRHGSVFQVQDPWPTSWYGAVWRQSIPRDITLGCTVGEAFTRGISHVGILYIKDPPQWWWDTGENVLYFGDPDLMIYVPSTEYSDANHWEQKDVQPLRYDSKAYVDGHMLYGATSHPHAYEPLPLM